MKGQQPAHQVVELRRIGLGLPRFIEQGLRLRAQSQVGHHAEEQGEGEAAGGPDEYGAGSLTPQTNAF